MWFRYRFILISNTRYHGEKRSVIPYTKLRTVRIWYEEFYAIYFEREGSYILNHYFTALYLD